VNGDQKTGVWIVALVVAAITVLILTLGWYYHAKDQRQAARGKANVDVVCTVHTPASRPS
jgi:uncharacterized membrane protein